MKFLDLIRNPSYNLNHLKNSKSKPYLFFSVIFAPLKKKILKDSKKYKLCHKKKHVTQKLN